MTACAEPPLTMNWTVDLQARPLDDEKVHMLGVHPAFIRTKPWPLPQSTETDVEPGMTTAIHQALVPLYQVTDRPPPAAGSESLSQAHGHSHWPLAAAVWAWAAGRRKAEKKRSATKRDTRAVNREDEEGAMVEVELV